MNVEHGESKEGLNFRHSGVGRNPEFMLPFNDKTTGFRPSPEWRKKTGSQTVLSVGRFLTFTNYLPPATSGFYELQW